jgi:hypothetical protein
MDKKFWGPAAWCTIHSAAAGYKIENRLSYKRFIYSLQQLLPCNVCRTHLHYNLTILPLTDQSLQNSNNLFMWTYFLHDLVNKQLRKRGSPSYSVVQREYYSKIGDNSFWGPCFWRTIHSFAAVYTPAAKEAFLQFIYSLVGVLPCQVCRDHYKRNLMQLPLTDEYLKDANNLFLWTFLLHDLVNKQLGKTSPTFESVKAQYFNQEVCESCG